MCCRVPEEFALKVRNVLLVGLYVRVKLENATPVIELSLEDTSRRFSLILRESRVSSPLTTKQWPSLKPTAIRESFSTSKAVTVTCDAKSDNCGVVWYSLMLRMQVSIGELLGLVDVDPKGRSVSCRGNSGSLVVDVSADSLIRHTFKTGTRSSLSVPIVTKYSLELFADAWTAPELTLLLMEQQWVTATLWAENENVYR